MLHPYRFTNGPTCTSSPRITSGEAHTLAGSSCGDITTVLSILFPDLDNSRRRERYWLSVIFERAIGRFEDLHYSEPAEPVAIGRNAAGDAIDEVIAFHLEPLGVLDTRDVHVAVAIRELKIAVSVVVRLLGDALVVHPDFFLQRGVVVHQHLARTYDRRAPNLVRVEPAHVHERNHVVWKAQREQRDVFDVIVIVALALAGHFNRHLTEQHQDDRDVVSGEIPGDVDVATEQPEIRAHRADVEDIAELTAVDQLADLNNRRAVLESVSRHQSEIALARHLDQLLGLLGRSS